MKFWNLVRRKRLGDAYAVITGDYAGQLFIYMEETDESVEVLSSPNMENISIPKEKFDFALTEGIVKFVERLPKDVRKVTELQFKQNKTGTSS